MAKIHTLKIKNYKGIQQFEQVFGVRDFVCLIGRGDSGKTTILDAISAVLSPSWNITFFDNDFYNGNIFSPIEIEASLYDLPKTLLQEGKFGLFIRGLDKSTGLIYDDLEDNHEIILTIQLKVERDLEPKWFVINNREAQQPIEIRANDRASLNVFSVSDYIDRHFSWGRGNPLYSLLREEDPTNEKTTVIIDALRDAKGRIDGTPFEHLDKVVEKIKIAASGLGVDIANTCTTIDFKDNLCTREGIKSFFLAEEALNRSVTVKALCNMLAKSLENSSEDVFMDDTEMEKLYSSYNGLVEVYVKYFSKYSGQKFSEKQLPAKNDFADSVHLLYLRDKEDIKIVSSDKFFKSLGVNYIDVKEAIISDV